MKALSIRQPWAWFMLHATPLKDVENRTWEGAYLKAQLALCPVGSNFLIHAASGMTEKEFKEACQFASGCGVRLFPQFTEVKRGGIVGMARLTMVVRGGYDSKWFTGPTGLVVAEPYPMPFAACKGALGFFETGEIYGAQAKDAVAEDTPQLNVES